MRIVADGFVIPVLDSLVIPNNQPSSFVRTANTF